MAKISINQKECIGCNLCSSSFPELFKFDDTDLKAKLSEDGKLVASILIELSPAKMEEAKKVSEDCPTKAIEIKE